MESTTIPPRESLACELFGEDGLHKFAIIATHAMEVEKQRDVIRRQSLDIKRLTASVTALKLKLVHADDDLEANVEDRERVITHKTEMIVELQRKNKDLQTMMGNTTELATMKHMNLYKSAETKTRKYEEKLQEAYHQLSTLSDFETTKDRLDQKILTLEEELREQGEAAKNDLRVVEQKQIAECDRMKQGNVRELKRFKAEVQVQLEQQFDQITVDTMADNKRLLTELEYQSAHIEKLIRTNNQFLKDKKDMKNRVEIQQGMLTKMAEKIKFFERLFKKMQLKEQAIKQQNQTVVVSNTLVEPANNILFPTMDSKSASPFQPETQQSLLHLTPKDKPVDHLHKATADLETFLLERSRTHKAIRSSINIKHQMPSAPPDARKQRFSPRPAISRGRSTPAELRRTLMSTGSLRHRSHVDSQS